uniref:Hyaluronan mediated motility receptor n=1 Tax=Terrapene triunguis TaxID=2587831 RepID=A0A674K8F5_9SAUR
GPVSSDKSQRFRKQKSRQFRKQKELKKQKMLEKEIRALVRERGEQDKRLQALEEDFMKSEAKLTAAVREKTSLSANVASLEKQLLELTRTNEFLKSKFSEDGTQKKMSSLCMELMKLRNKMEAKSKNVLAKQEDMEMKLQAVQRNLVQSKGKVAQLEEKLTATERDKVEEKSDTEKLLEYITELSGVAEQIEKYKLDLVHMEKILAQKDQDIMALKDCFTTKEEQLSKLIKELNERCQLLEQEKGNCYSLWNREKEQSMNAEIESLKKRLLLEEQEHQKLQHKQEEIYSQLQQEKELFTSIQQKLLEFQEEMTNERLLLEEELEEAMDELDKLHIKEEKADKLVKHLEQENKSRAEELAQMEAKLKGFVKRVTLPVASNEFGNTGLSHLTLGLRSTVNAKTFPSSYKVSMTEEMACLRLDNSSLQEKVAELRKAGQDTQQQLQEMLLDAQTKLALKEAEIRRTKESCIAQITKLQTKLEEQTEDFKKQLEVERSRKTIDEKVSAGFQEEIQTWQAVIAHVPLPERSLPQTLFQQQLDAFEAEKNALTNEHGAAQEELNKLSDAYAKLLGHQNQRQKIKHVMKLKDENAQLKQEVSKLRAQVAKEKQAQRELQEQLNEIQGIRRFDSSKAFQHDSKENVAPKTPLKEGKCGC